METTLLRAPWASAVDWTTQGFVIPWMSAVLADLFPTTGALDAAWALSTGNLVSLIEKQVVEYHTINLNLAVSLVILSQVHFNEICVTEGVAGGSPLRPGLRY